MADSHVQLPADGAGKALATESFTQATAPSSTAHLQKLILTDKNGNVLNRAYGPLRVSTEDKSLFYDPFDSLDTVDRWTASGANAPTVATSSLTFGVATTASAYGKVTSKVSFLPIIPGFLQASFAIGFPDAGATYRTGGHRFWGIGTSPVTPATTSAATKMTDGIGFEIDTDGKMYAVVYRAGVRIFATDLSSTGTGDAANMMPTTTAQTRYIVQVRTDRIFWFIEGFDTPVATAVFQVPSAQQLPLLKQTVNPATGVATGGYPMEVQGTVVADTAGHHMQIADGIHQWRKTEVTPARQLSASIKARRSQYAFASGLTTAVTGTAGVKPLLSIWHPATEVRTVLLKRLVVYLEVPWTGTTGRATFNLAHATTDGATGTVVTPQPLNRGDAASGTTIRAIPGTAPTVTGTNIRSVFRPPGANTIDPASFQFDLLTLDDEPVVLRGGQAEGLYLFLNVTTALTGSPQVSLEGQFEEV